MNAPCYCRLLSLVEDTVIQLNEFENYLSQLSARAVLVQSGHDSPAIAAAKSCGIPVISLAVEWNIWHLGCW